MSLFFPLGCRLDVYIYDYLMKRKFHASAKAFQAEGKVSTDPVGKSLYKLHWQNKRFPYMCMHKLQTL